MAAEKRWREGRTLEDRWIVGTQAFGQGVDYPSVRFVIHLDPREMINFFQETSRGGRDSNPCYCYCLYRYLPSPFTDNTLVDHLGRTEMIEFLTTGSCVRLAFGALDREVHSCVALNAELCYNCERLVQVEDVTTFIGNPRFDLPMISSRDDTLDGVMREVPVSVESNAKLIQEELAASERQLRKLDMILE
uniref:DNA 3'-5' helicase n=1 Tax=Moniliophthora roreri TaxID=221103 RepID=A0A0W0FD63_MONRR